MKRLLLLLLTGLMVLVVAPVYANTYGSGTYGSCQYGSCSISLTSSGSVNINVTPSQNGTCTINNGSVSVSTDDSSGYSLTIQDNSTDNALISGTYSIASTSGTFSLPIPLTANSWGYRVDNTGSFGPGPTSQQNNVPLNSTKFAQIPSASSSPDMIIDNPTATDSTQTTNIWYGVCANMSTASGAYSTQVTYTAITNN